jgi:iron(III) transport system ATP-binding protein
VLKVDQLRKAFGRTAVKHARGVRDGDESSDELRERTYAIDGVTFEVNEGDFFTLIGPSGCGKTTTLRSIAGLERPDEGTISLDGKLLFSREQSTNVAVNERGLGMVFQSYAIWPHLDVFRNVALPLEVSRRRRKLTKKDIRNRVESVLEVTGLLPMINKPATNLSGGQQQRLALARALATEPRLMLLDEPLSNLDAKLRETMRLELTRLQKQLGLTSVYVTHDQAEALALSTMILVMDEGRIVQAGRPREVYEHPNGEFVAQFLGTSNMLAGVAAETADGLLRITTDTGDIWATADEIAVGAKVVAAIRPENVIITTEHVAGVRNRWHGRVLAQAFLGDTVDYMLVVGDTELRCRTTGFAERVEAESEISITFAPERVRVLPVNV